MNISLSLTTCHKTLTLHVVMRRETHAFLLLARELTTVLSVILKDHWTDQSVFASIISEHEVSN